MAVDIYDTLFQKESSIKEDYAGITVGIIKENWEEANKGKVKVELISGEEGKTETAWIRVASMYTENKAGYYLLPEIGTEVLIAFIDGNRNNPVVIGSLWNEKHELAPNFATEKNTIKGFRTKCGHEIIWDEEKDKEKLQIQTIGKIQVSLLDETKTVKITDEDGKNCIVVDFKNGAVTLDAEKEIHLSVGKKDILKIDQKSILLKADNITIEGGQNLTLKGQSTELKGNKVNMKSDASLEVKAGATLKLEGSAITEVKGGMLKLN